MRSTLNYRGMVLREGYLGVGLIKLGKVTYKAGCVCGIYAWGDFVLG